MCYFLGPVRGFRECWSWIRHCKIFDSFSFYSWKKKKLKIHINPQKINMLILCSLTENSMLGSAELYTLKEDIQWKSEKKNPLYLQRKLKQILKVLCKKWNVMLCSRFRNWQSTFNLTQSCCRRKIVNCLKYQKLYWILLCAIERLSWEEKKKKPNQTRVKFKSR